MAIIDEDGFLFGVVNAIDVIVVLLVLLILVAGVSVMTRPGPDATQTEQTITFQSVPQPSYVVDAISEGPVPTDEVLAIESKSVTQHDEASFVVTLRIRLDVRTNADGLPTFEDERLYVGRELRLDLGSTILDGTVIDIEPRTTAGD